MVMVNSIALSVAIASGGIGAASTNVAYFNFLSAALLVLGMHLLIFEDVIEELRHAAARAGHQPRRDEGDGGHRSADALLQPPLALRDRRARARTASPLQAAAVAALLDIDHFKAINDTRGHHTGDEVLKTIGAILRELTRQADYVFRWGGDEFLVLLSASEAGSAKTRRADPPGVPRVRDRR